MPNLQVVADALKLPVSYTGAVSEEILGVYGHEQGDKAGKSGKITLYSHDLQVFYHELVWLCPFCKSPTSFFDCAACGTSIPNPWL